MRPADLPKYTWDQATILKLATANGFEAVSIRPATVRAWASDGLVAAVGKAPGGAHLYSIAAVLVVAARPRKKAGRPRTERRVAPPSSIPHT